MLLYTVIKTPKKFIANKIDTVGAVKRPPAQMQPERERERKTKDISGTIYLKWWGATELHGAEYEYDTSIFFFTSKYKTGHLPIKHQHQ